MALRCAIYTRKSSEEGLEQGFNSLDAQREACAAYVASQTHEGWRLIRTRYDDGGISGGTMERPALQALLADIEAGLIDVVVVYKVDRLTRSLGDFARIIEVFDRRNVSFVSVTQAFNTTSSMGRLTLNVLLSFAQFEREVTGERIRDKIAASKAKGLWLGGNPPLGYNPPTDPKVRVLALNPAEAETVRYIFQRYLELGSVNALREALRAEGIVSKSWKTESGRERGGMPIGTGALFHLLKNRVYRGEVGHKGKFYPADHPPIVDEDLFAAVQAQLKSHTVRRREAIAKGPTAALAFKGLIFDAEGSPMTPSLARGQHGQRYAYYVSAPRQRGQAVAEGVVARVAASEIEGLVLDRLRALQGKQDAPLSALVPLIVRIEVLAQGVRLVLTGSGLIGDGNPEDQLGKLRARLDPLDRLDYAPRAKSLHLLIGVRPVFRGGRTWMVRPNGEVAIGAGDRALLKALLQAHEGLAQYSASPSQGPSAWRQAEAIPWSYLRQMFPLAFLAPDLQRMILEGRQPAGLTTAQLIKGEVPLGWADQRRLFGVQP